MKGRRVIPNLSVLLNPGFEKSQEGLKQPLIIFHENTDSTAIQQIYKRKSREHSYTAKQNFYKYKVKTNAGKQSFSYMAIDIWKDLPSSLKDLSVFVFPKYMKRYLLSEQKRNQFFT